MAVPPPVPPFVWSPPFTTTGSKGAVLAPATVWTSPAIFVPVRESLSKPTPGPPSSITTGAANGTGSGDQVSGSGAADTAASAGLPARPPAPAADTRTERLDGIIAAHEAHSRAVRANLAAMFRQRERDMVEAYRVWERSVVGEDRERDRRRSVGEGDAAGSDEAGAEAGGPTPELLRLLRDWDFVPELPPHEEQALIDSLKAAIPGLPPAMSQSQSQPQPLVPGQVPGQGNAGAGGGGATAGTGSAAGGPGRAAAGAQGAPGTTSAVTLTGGELLADYYGPGGARTALDRLTAEDVVPAAVLAGQAVGADGQPLAIGPRQWLALARLRLTAAAADQIDGYEGHARRTVGHYRDARQREEVRHMMSESWAAQLPPRPGRPGGS